MEQRHIVAIDIGSGNIALTVAKVEGDNVQIIYHNTTPSVGVKYAQIVNRQKASDALKSALDEAQAELGLKFTQVVVNYPKYDIRQKDANVTFERDPNKFITAEELENMKNSVGDSFEGKDEDEEILSVVAQSYNGNSEIQISENDVVGMALGKIECNFKLFSGTSHTVSAIDSAIENAGTIVCRKFFTPETTANAVLFETETANGVALIDFGAGVTSVSIFEKNVLRYYGAIPFGGKSITTDIKNECQISEKLAESIKLAYGGCKPDRLPDIGDKTLKITTNPALSPKLVTVKYLSEIVTARATEIVNAILYKIQESGFASRLRSGVVITGGGANLLNISVLISELSGYSVRLGLPKKTFSSSEPNNTLFGTCTASSIGLILAAKANKTINCAVQNDLKPVVEEEETPPPPKSLFEDDPIEEPQEPVKPVREKEKEDKPKKKKSPKEPSKGLLELFGDWCKGISNDINTEEI